MRSLPDYIWKRASAGCAWLGAFCISAQVLAAASAQQGPPSLTSLAGLPLFFEASSKGSDEAFVARGQNCQVMIKPASARIFLVRPQVADSTPRSRETAGSHRSLDVRAVRMDLVGASHEAKMSCASPLAGKINEFSGAPAEWQTQITTWAQVRVDSVYAGIDAIYYGNQDKLEYDFHVAPGADPSSILLKFSGVDSLTIDSHGDLVLGVGEDEIRQHCPVVYQVIEGRRNEIAGAYEKRGERTVGFKVGEFRRDLPLVIDPVLSYASYFGGSSGDISLAIRLGPDQSIYIAGQTLSRKFLFPIPDDAFQRSFKGGTVSGDAFVAKFDSTGSNLVYFTYLGGSAEDGALDLAVDTNGNAFVVGLTTSGNFPVRKALFGHNRSKIDSYLGTYSREGFVSVLNPSGSELVYSTYLGGYGGDIVTAVAVDESGAAWITGTTSSTNFPVVNPLPGQRHRAKGQDAFVSKIAPGGGSLLFSTYFGGNQTDVGQGIACDSEGSAYVVGYTSSPNIPITNAFQTLVNNKTNVTGALDAFVAKFSAQGALLYSTFLGRAGNDAAYRVAVDSVGNAYVAGYTQSKLFPNTMTNVVGLTNVSKASVLNSDAFLAKIGVDSAGVSELLYSAVLGGTANDSGWDVAVTPSGEAYTVGITASRNFPTNNTAGFLSRTNSGKADVFVAGISADASTLLFSGYLGGSKADYGYGIALSPGGEVYITGRSVSTNFPPANAVQPRRNGANDAFIAVISPEPVLQAASVSGGWDLRWWGGIGPEYALEISATPAQTEWLPAGGQVKRDGGWRSVHVPSQGVDAAFFRLQRR